MENQDIKQLRKKLELTQQELADLIGVNRITVHRWECGKKKPSNLARRQLQRLQEKAN
jgi:DNA-binding transcriptional regulator YiaG